MLETQLILDLFFRRNIYVILEQSSTKEKKPMRPINIRNARRIKVKRVKDVIFVNGEET